MLHVWYIYLQNWVMFFGKMLVNIPAPWFAYGICFMNCPSVSLLGRRYDIPLLRWLHPAIASSLLNTFKKVYSDNHATWWLIHQFSNDLSSKILHEFPIIFHIRFAIWGWWDGSKHRKPMKNEYSIGFREIIISGGTKWWFGTFGSFFHILGRIIPTEFHHPNWRSHISRGVGQPPTSYWCMAMIAIFGLWLLYVGNQPPSFTSFLFHRSAPRSHHSVGFPPGDL